MSDNDINKPFGFTGTMPLKTAAGSTGATGSTGSHSPGPGEFKPAVRVGGGNDIAKKDANNFNAPRFDLGGAGGSSLTSEIKADAKELGAQAKDAAKDLGDQAKDAASQLVSQTKDLVRSQVAKQSDRGVNDLAAVADALRKTGDNLEDNMVAPYIGKAADQIDRVSSFIRTADPKQVIRQVEAFARREPLIFLGGAFALGMLGARFIKSSSEGASQRSDEDQTEGNGGVTR